MRHICLDHPEKSAVAEHRFETGCISFNGISILNKVTGFMDLIIKDAIKITIHPRKFSSVGGFTPESLTGLEASPSVTPSTQ
jgi:hypothetical protein